MFKVNLELIHRAKVVTSLSKGIFFNGSKGRYEVEFKRSPNKANFYVIKE